jgi:hypothetical protein
MDRFRCAWPLIWTVVVAAGAGCGPTAAGDFDGGPHGPCTAADPPRCEGLRHLTCQGGAWVSETCAVECVAATGCHACAPGERFCIGAEVHECQAGGQASTLLTTCPADQQCVAGACVAACEQALGTRSNVGCEFWAEDLPNEYYCTSLDGGKTCDTSSELGYGCAACEQFAVVVTNTSANSVHVTIEQNEAAPGAALRLTTVAEKDVGPGALELFPLPMREVDCTEWYTDTAGLLRRKNDSTSCLSSRAYRVTSDYPVVAYQFNPVQNDFSNGASLLIPTNGLDLDHLVLGWFTTQWGPATVLPGETAEGFPDHTAVTVVGVLPDTHVEVVTAHGLQASPDGTIPKTEAGGTVTATLGPFDVLNLSSYTDIDHQSGDFTGTRVRADKPIAVFSSTQRSVVPMAPTSYSPPPPMPSPYSLCCTEHFEQQMFPVSSLGTKFVLTRTPVRSSTNLVEPDM